VLDRTVVGAGAKAAATDRVARSKAMNFMVLMVFRNGV
jgi:hypothetical protein